MLALEIVSGVIIIFSFFYGAIKLWKKGKPLYYQILIAAVGCYALYQLFVIVMCFCDAGEIYFNDGLFGLLGCYLFLLCANTGAFEKIFDKPKKRFIFISVLAGVALFALSVGAGLIYFEGINNPVFYIFVSTQIPACLVVYFNVKHLFTPLDELGLIKDLRLSDIVSIIFCVASVLDFIAWSYPGIISGIADVIFSLITLAMTLTAIRGAKKWNY